MPRPPRCRRICQAPQYETFSPEECPRESEAVTLTLDEYVSHPSGRSLRRKLTNNVLPRWTFPGQLSQKFMKLPEKKLPDVSSLDSALS